MAIFPCHGKAMTKTFFKHCINRRRIRHGYCCDSVNQRPRRFLIKHGRNTIHSYGDNHGFTTIGGMNVAAEFSASSFCPPDRPCAHRPRTLPARTPGQDTPRPRRRGPTHTSAPSDADRGRGAPAARPGRATAARPRSPSGSRHHRSVPMVPCPTSLSVGNLAQHRRRQATLPCRVSSITTTPRRTLQRTVA